MYFKIDLNVYAVVILLVSLLFPVLFTPFAWLWFGLASVVEAATSQSRRTLYDSD